MPRLTTVQTEILDRLAREHGSSLAEIRANRNSHKATDAERQENTARASAPPVTRKAVKFDLGAFIRTVKQIPDGKYALVGKDGETIHFFEVIERGNRNWVNRLFGAPGNFRSERMSYQWMHAAAVRIAEDPKAAAVLFGQTVGVCARCDSPLTNAESRERGLGPVCAKVY